MRAHRLAPNDLSALFYLVHNLKYLSFDEQVLEYAEKMLQLDPMHVGARLFRPQLAVYHGDTGKAMQ